MAINVVCPGCHKRFAVDEKFAGKRGPCPKCKAQITIPAKGEEVVVHAPESFGPKDAKGRAVLKPIFREEAKLTPVTIAGIAGAVLVIFILAFVVRFSTQGAVGLPILALGAILLAPPLVYAGYTFLRNDDLEPHRGQSLWIRVAICAVVYAAIWGFVGFLNGYLFEGGGFSLPFVVVIVALMIVGGAGVAFVSLDLDFGSGLFHYGLYLLVTVLLRLIVLNEAFPIDQ